MKEISTQNRTIDLTSIGGLKFVESTHSYFNKDGIRYNGVTTLLKKYEHEFNSELGSLNSAIKEVVIKNFGQEKFNVLKKSCREDELKFLRDQSEKKFLYGHNFLYKKLDSITKKYPNLKDDISNTRVRLLKEWKDTSDEAIRIGSLEHDSREQQIKNMGYTFDGVHYKYQENKNIMNVTTDDVIVIPECLVWNHGIKLGGLADVFLFNKGTIYVHDYKTNESIDLTSFNQKMMKGVCSSLMDSNFFHYSLQLKIYQKMATLLRPDFKMGNNMIISTKSEKYNRSEDNIILCHKTDFEVDLIFDELRSGL